jgi:hypothetical protein
LRQFHYFILLLLCFVCVVRSLGELGTVGQSAGTAARADFSGNFGAVRVCGLADCSADIRAFFLRNHSVRRDLLTAERCADKLDRRAMLPD